MRPAPFRLLLMAVMLWATTACPSQQDTNPARAARRPTPPDLLDEGQAAVATVRGRTYVPCYSHIYTGSGGAKDVAVTLSVRNVSSTTSLVLDSVKFFDTHGKIIDDLLAGRSHLAPLQTAEFFIATQDQRGGSGANFLVDWRVEPDAPRPVSEAVMVRDDLGERTFAFSLRGIDVPLEASAPRATPAGADAGPR